jgi:SAM-dependent methyltransferase
VNSARANSFIGSLTRKLRPYLPFTVLNVVWFGLDKNSRSILDVGCGKGEPMDFFNRTRNFHVVGADIFKPSIKLSKSRKIHDDYVVCDVRALPFKQGSFEIVIMLEVLEHLGKNEGEPLIRSLEKIAIKQVIITTPVGRYPQFNVDENLYWEHKWIWSPSDLRALGYTVKGVGLRNMGGQEGLYSRFPEIIAPVTNLHWILAGFVTYFVPLLSGHMVCSKTLRKSSFKIEASVVPNAAEST